MDDTQRCMLICAVVIVLILFLIMRVPRSSAERFASSPAAQACAMCMKFPKGQACAHCRAARAAQAAEHLSDVGACSTICDKWPGSQGCAACLNRQPPGSDQNLRGAVIGLLE